MRCVKPNGKAAPAGAPGAFEPKAVLEQLRCSGVFDAVDLMTAAQRGSKWGLLSLTTASHLAPWARARLGGALEHPQGLQLPWAPPEVPGWPLKGTHTHTHTHARARDADSSPSTTRNAVGPLALRNDDIVKCLSGKTVEINNTDAEGRLVLADGVAHATASPPKLPGGAARLEDAAGPLGRRRFLSRPGWSGGFGRACALGRHPRRLGA